MLTIRCRRAAGKLMEHASEVGRIVEADFRRNIGDAGISTSQQLLGLMDSIARQVLPRREGQLLAKDPAEIVLGHADRLCDLPARERAVEMLLEVHDRPLDQSAGWLRQASARHNLI